MRLRAPEQAPVVTREGQAQDSDDRISCKEPHFLPYPWRITRFNLEGLCGVHSEPASLHQLSEPQLSHLQQWARRCPPHRAVPSCEALQHTHNTCSEVSEHVF